MQAFCVSHFFEWPVSEQRRDYVEIENRSVLGDVMVIAIHRHLQSDVGSHLLVASVFKSPLWYTNQSGFLF